MNITNVTNLLNMPTFYDCDDSPLETSIHKKIFEVSFFIFLGLTGASIYTRRELGFIPLPLKFLLVGNLTIFASSLIYLSQDISNHLFIPECQ